jgi:1,4-dihydroxy-2-naphthoate octaprenyltransferase
LSLPNNLVRLGVLLFAFGAVTGLLLAASFGTRLGTVFGLLLVLAALGMLLQSSVAEDDEDEEEEEDDEEPEKLGDASLRSIAQILHSLITGSAFFWAIMTFVTHFFGYEFDRNTWLLPPIYGLLIGGWSVMLDQAQSIKQVLEQRAKGKQDE